MNENIQLLRMSRRARHEEEQSAAYYEALRKCAVEQIGERAVPAPDESEPTPAPAVAAPTPPAPSSVVPAEVFATLDELFAAHHLTASEIVEIPEVSRAEANAMAKATARRLFDVT